MKKQVISFIKKKAPIKIDVDEIWVDLEYDNIRGNYYEISNLGNLQLKNFKKQLNPSINRYRMIGLMQKDGTRKFYKVSRIVGYIFVPNLDIKNKIFINHKDLNKLHDYSDNLEWVTPKENTQHAILNKSHPAANKGEKNVKSLITDETAHKICKLLEKNKTVSEIISNLDLPDTSKMYNIVSNIRRKNSWLHISSLYEIPQSEQKYTFSNNQVHTICELLQECKSYNEIIEFMGFNNNRAFNEGIGNIKRHITYKNISKNYIF